MANKTDFSSGPNQISKDVQGSDNSLPLSPQWLLPKPGENKLGMLPGENLFGSLPGHVSFSDVPKLPESGVDMNENRKKKDVFRPSVMEMESGRHDRWHDEERDTNSAVRKDRWKEREREHIENRMGSFRTDSSGKHYGESFRVQTDRWTDSGKRDSYDQRRETKWSTRWGPDYKETDALREKGDCNKESDMLLDKGSSHIPSHGKDEKGSGHHRPWRPSISYSRGKAESNPQNSSPYRPFPAFSHGRGRVENSATSFSIGNGSISLEESSAMHMNANCQAHISEKIESGCQDNYPLKYNRSSLIDIYRKIDMRTSASFFEGAVRVQMLTQEEPLEPQALHAPTSEELTILNGIDKGEIISGAPQISKDGYSGRTTTELMLPKPRIGSKDDLVVSVDDSKYEVLDNAKAGYSNYSADLSHGKDIYSSRNMEAEAILDAQAFSDHKLVADAVTVDSITPGKNAPSRESSTPGHSSTRRSSSWRKSPSFAERSLSHDWKETSGDVQKEFNSVWENHLMDSPTAMKGPKREINDHVIRRQTSDVFDLEFEPHRVSQTSPEDLIIFYKDPQGEIQGPFVGSDIITWFEAGYFGLELQVRLASAPADSLFSSLGDVMPHLRAKAQPPPGFSVPKTIEHQDLAGRLTYNNFGKNPAVSSDPNLLKNDPRYAHSSRMDSENRFLASLMSGSMNGAPIEKLGLSEGAHGYTVNSSSSLAHVTSDSGVDPGLLSKNMLLERQNPLPNPFSIWPPRDAISFAAKADMRDPLLAHSMLSSSIPDNARAPQYSQTKDLMSPVHGLNDRPSSNVNSGISGLLNFSAQGGLDSSQDKLGIHHSQKFPQQFAFGMQQQRLQPSSNLYSQSTDNQPNMLTQEILTTAGLPQDPQLLSLLQQQYLSQLQSQASVLPQQLTLLDKLLLLKHQQKQEEHIMQQQKQLLSQVLSEHHPYQVQQLVEPSLLNLPHSNFTGGNAGMDLVHLQQLNDLSQMGAHKQLNLQDEAASSINLPPNTSPDISLKVASESSAVHLPHINFETNMNQMNWDAPLLEKDGNQRMKSSSIVTAAKNKKPEIGMENEHSLEQTSHYEESVGLATSESSSVVHVGPESSSVKLPYQLIGNNMEQMNWDAPLLEKDGNRYLKSSSVVTTTMAVKPKFEMQNEDSLEQRSHYQESVKLVTSDSTTVVLPGEYSNKTVDQTTEMLIPQHPESLAKAQARAFEDPQEIGDQYIDNSHLVKEVKSQESQEIKKSSDKKSKKQRSLKVSVDSAKSASKTQQSNSSEFVSSSVNEKSEKIAVRGGAIVASVQEKEKQKTRDKDLASSDHLTGLVSVPNVFHPDDGVSTEVKGTPEEVPVDSHVPPQKARTWKSAPGFKPKSLIEIQQEEQRRAQEEMAASEMSVALGSMSIEPPWAGVVVNSDQKFFVEIQQDVNGSNSRKTENVSIPKSKKNLENDLLLENNDKSVEKELEFLDSASRHVTSPQAVSFNDFIEAKDTKRSRKKSAKAKGAGTKSTSMPSVDISVQSSPSDKGKLIRQLQQEKEVLPAVPSGPSLGDFVVWKGEATSPSLAPAWSTDSGKSYKPASLRDILREQESKSSSSFQTAQVPNQKPAVNQLSHVGGPSWGLSMPVNNKAAAPIPINSQGGSHSKHKVDDDLFWGPVEQLKPAEKQTEFPLLKTQVSLGSKNTSGKGENTSGKGALGMSSNWQKSIGTKPVEYSPSAPVSSMQPCLKGKKGALTKHSEATDFKEWCENECNRLIRSKDTSFLEFCFKQTREEAELLLIENLGSYDPHHEFIDKFLNYKNFLPADVFEIASKIQNTKKATPQGAGDPISERVKIGEPAQSSATAAADGDVKGKKKGKKGKKVSASVLGFNVVSNRIMMGEIQTVED